MTTTAADQANLGEWNEIVDDGIGLLLRRVAVGPMSTNSYTIASTRTRAALLIDPGAEPGRILDSVADLDVRQIVLTHAHFDHVEALADVADDLGAPIAAHPADAPVWPREMEHLRVHGHFDAGLATEELLAAGCPLCPAPGVAEWDGHVDRLLTDGETIGLDDLDVRVLHTPGHTPGGLSLLVGQHLLSGDTLFPGGPGLTGWPLSDFDTIIHSVRDRLFSLPDGTNVHPGHGRSTQIGAERPHLDEWIARGW